MTQTPNSNEETGKPRETRTTGLLAAFSALWLLLGILASISGFEYSELSDSPDSWKYVEDQFRGKRHTCSSSRSGGCGLWLYLNIHEERLFYGWQRPNYARLKQTTLRGKSVQVWYVCPWGGRCVPGELIVEGLGTIVSFEQTEQELRTTAFFRFLLAAVTLVPGLIFSFVVYRRLLHPPSPSHPLGLSDIES